MCQKDGGHLASIHSLGEQKFIMDLMENAYPFWIGLTDPKEGTFEWMDSSQVNFNKWDPSEPNNLPRSADCVEIWHTGNWFDEWCGKRRKYICKQEAMRNLTSN
ncbi:C-type lectin lectoxin-Thr1-like [Amphiura filiformis]|uniref:C-type lectin lectoxin-Thr1-like n=1 Tax=Amphiura filiformis TaxID=82378 RepID=UPI003B20D6A1